MLRAVKLHILISIQRKRDVTSDWIYVLLQVNCVFGNLRTPLAACLTVWCVFGASGFELNASYTVLVTKQTH